MNDRPPYHSLYDTIVPKALYEYLALPDAPGVVFGFDTSCLLYAVRARAEATKLRLEGRISSDHYKQLLKELGL